MTNVGRLNPINIGIFLASAIISSVVFLGDEYWFHLARYWEFPAGIALGTIGGYILGRARSWARDQ